MAFSKNFVFEYRLIKTIFVYLKQYSNIDIDMCVLYVIYVNFIYTHS